MRRSRARRLVPAAIGLALVLGLLPGRMLTASTATSAGSTGETSFTPTDDLNRSIDEVLERPEYRWRTRDTTPGLERLLERLQAHWERIESFIRSIVEWFEGRVESDETTPRGLDIDAALVRRIAIVVALLAGALVLAYLWKTRRPSPVAAEVAEPISLEVLSREESDAAEVPSRRWLEWATELEAEGRSREAVRALYLATLSHLSESGRLRLERYKSNRDYRLELDRRVGPEGLLSVRFAGCVSIFERVWYGLDRADGNLFERMAAGAREILDHEQALAVPPAGRSA